MMALMVLMVLVLAAIECRGGVQWVLPLGTLQKVDASFKAIHKKGFQTPLSAARSPRLQKQLHTALNLRLTQSMGQAPPFESGGSPKMDHVGLLPIFEPTSVSQKSMETTFSEGPPILQAQVLV